MAVATMVPPTFTVSPTEYVPGENNFHEPIAGPIRLGEIVEARTGKLKRPGCPFKASAELSALSKTNSAVPPPTFTLLGSGIASTHSTNCGSIGPASTRRPLPHGSMANAFRPLRSITCSLPAVLAGGPGRYVVSCRIIAAGEAQAFSLASGTESSAIASIGPRGGVENSN